MTFLCTNASINRFIMPHHILAGFVVQLQYMYILRLHLLTKLAIAIAHRVCVLRTLFGYRDRLAIIIQNFERARGGQRENKEEREN